ncbi:MAG: PIN domain-containing protein [Armatimonadetes bacterium]|nr:PIN domain-containing protein [Armatimonadota bacterium]
MIALDTNILVYAHRGDMPFHTEALSTLRRVLEGGEPWALPYQVLHEFYSIMTNPRLFADPTEPSVAIGAILELLRCPQTVLLSETGNYFPVLQKVLWGGDVRGGKVHDARIVALCLCHGVDEIYSADRDFSRFTGFIRITNPCARETPS